MKIRLSYIVLLWVATSSIGAILKITHQLDQISVILLAISLGLSVVVVYKIVKTMIAS